MFVLDLSTILQKELKTIVLLSYLQLNFSFLANLWLTYLLITYLSPKKNTQILTSHANPKQPSHQLTHLSLILVHFLPYQESS